MRAYKENFASKHPETGFDRVITLTAEEVVEILRLMDGPVAPKSTFRLDTEGFVRRRLQGGPTIGKVAAVETVIFAIIRAGLLVIGQRGRASESGSGAAPDIEPSLSPGSGTAPAIGGNETRPKLEAELVPVTFGALSAKASIEAGSGAAPSVCGVRRVEEPMGVKSEAQPRVGYTGTSAVQNEGRGGAAPVSGEVPVVGRDFAQEARSRQPQDVLIKAGIWNRRVSESTIFAGFLMLLVFWIPVVLLMWTM
jgi:hypothetical protein